MNEQDQIWYLPDETSLRADGPYSTLEILAMVKDGAARIDSFIFRAEFKHFGWKRICEIEDFSELLLPRPVCPTPKTVSQGNTNKVSTELHLEAVKGEYGVENVYRRYPRAPVSCSGFVHNDKYLVEARMDDISESGTCFIFDSPNVFKTGDELMITARCPSPIDTFSVRGAAVRGIVHGQSLMLAIYFLQLNPAVRRRIAQYVLQELSKISKETPEKNAA